MSASSLPEDDDRVSIVIPTYEQADRLPAAIESALAQTYEHLEVLVLDDASPDATPAVVERYRADPRFRDVRHASNQGRVANYRAGLAEARGSWVLMLDGDDVLLDREFVAAAVAAARRDPTVVLAVGGVRWREMEAGRIRDQRPTRRHEERLEGWDFFLRWVSPAQVVPHLGSLYRAAEARAIGFYAHDVLSSDWESLRRLCLRGRVVLLGRIAGEWRGHAANVSRTHEPRPHADNVVAILEPWREARDAGHDGMRLRLWKWDAIRRHAAVYLETAFTRGDGGAVAAYREALGRHIGVGPAAWVVGLGIATRPSIWIKALLHALGGAALLGRARRAWHRLTWKRG